MWVVVWIHHNLVPRLGYTTVLPGSVHCPSLRPCPQERKRVYLQTRLLHSGSRFSSAGYSIDYNHDLTVPTSFKAQGSPIPLAIQHSHATGSDLARLDLSHPVRKACKAAKKHFRSCLRLHRKSLSEKFFSSLDAHTTDPHRFFQAIRRHTLSNSFPPTQRLLYEGKEYTHDNILDGWATYFESLTTPDDSPFTEEHLKIIESYYHSLSLPADEPDLVSEEEVVAIIHSLPSKKAPGPDNVTNEHLKFGGSVLPTILTALFNAVLRSGHIMHPLGMVSLYLFPRVTTKIFQSPLIIEVSPYYLCLAKFSRKCFCIVLQICNLN